MKIKVLNFKNRVMLRVYGIYCRRLATHTITLHTAVLLLAVWTLFEFVSVHNVILNWLSVPLIRLPYSIANAFLETDFIVVFAVAVFVMTLISLRFALAHTATKSMQMA